MVLPQDIVDYIFQYLDYEEICQLSKKYNSLYQQKIYYENMIGELSLVQWISSITNVGYTPVLGLGSIDLMLMYTERQLKLAAIIKG